MGCPRDPQGRHSMDYRGQVNYNGTVHFEYVCEWQCGYKEYLPKTGWGGASLPADSGMRVVKKGCLSTLVLLTSLGIVRAALLALALWLGRRIRGSR